jgi:hypothetical protein
LVCLVVDLAAWYGSRQSGENSSGAAGQFVRGIVIENEMFIAWGTIKQFLADLAGSALTVAMPAERASKDGLPVVTAGRV